MKDTKFLIECRDPLLRYRHPDDILKELLNLIKKIGAKNFLHGAGQNRERDAFVGCLFAYAVRKYQRREFFFQQNSDPPDFELIAPTERALREGPFDHFNIEIVTVPPMVDTSDQKLDYATDLLSRTKFSPEYKPDPGTILLVFINATCGTALSDELASWVIKNKPPEFGEVMCIYLLSVSAERSFTYIVKSLIHPEISWTLNLKEEFNQGTIYPHPLIGKFGRKMI